VQTVEQAQWIVYSLALPIWQRHSGNGILATVEADAQRYFEAGSTMVAVGSDLAMLRQNSQALAERFKS